MVHAIPIPRKTLTALEPVTFPTEASAVSSPMAAVLEAKVSKTPLLLCYEREFLPGTEVPRATNEMAVTASVTPTVQPK